MSWQRQWAADRLGAELLDPAGQSLIAADLLDLAVRHNPRRAHLLVSRVLGKHLPADPVLVYASSRLLGLLVAGALTGNTGQAEVGRRLLAAALAGQQPAEQLLAHCERPAASAPPTVVIGFAETATGLGHGVADALQARYLHSTRRRSVGPAIRFHEEHSHAVDHLLQPADPNLLGVNVPLVLVDDELSTGQTALNLIGELQPHCPARTRYLIAALVDLRTAADRDRMTALAAELGVRIEVVALATAELRLAPDVLARGSVLAVEHDRPDAQSADPISTISTLHWPASVVADGRHGFDPVHREPLERAACQLAAQLAGRVGDRVLVLGCEELMYAPLRIAIALAGLRSPGQVRFSATTRSPVVTVDRSGYPIRTRLRFPAHDDAAGPRYAYNVRPGLDPDRRFTDIVLVVDDVADTPALRQPDGLLAQLATATDRIWLVRIPASRPSHLPSPLHGPAFGSYRPDEVSWLLTDLSGTELEAPAEEREEAIQAGTAHYAESLPIEYQPGEQYLALYRQALARSADRLAYAVGVVAELLLAEHGPDLVLASLARAGTPVGALIRRWAQQLHDLELPHYAISIVRGRGIDELALRYLASRYATERVAFVDGWTGKGAIARELATAIGIVNDRLGSRFSAELAVLADPGHCARIYGTRQDYLIPSACLNSTVSGLISRTVLNDRLIGSGQFHGAKFYSELVGADVSGAFLDAVSTRFAAVADQVSSAVREWKPVEPSWQGWLTVEQLAGRYGIDDLNLIKPGVGETTRVLLRRVPWKVLIRPDALAELDHLLLLAEQRGVPVEPVDDLCFSSVGLIKPGFSRD